VGYYLGKAAVSGNPEAAFLKQLAHTPGNFEFMWKKYSPWVRAPPQEKGIIAEPGENPGAIGQHEPLGAEVSADGEQAFRSRPGYGREDQALAEDRDRYMLGFHNAFFERI
jgi:hypothetical protein